MRRLQLEGDDETWRSDPVQGVWTSSSVQRENQKDGAVPGAMIGSNRNPTSNDGVIVIVGVDGQAECFPFVENSDHI